MGYSHGLVGSQRTASARPGATTRDVRTSARVAVWGRVVGAQDVNADPPQLRFGRAHYWVPICILHPHGFYGGPAGYQEMSFNLARKQSPIILVYDDTYHSSIPAPDTRDAI